MKMSWQFSFASFGMPSPDPKDIGVIAPSPHSSPVKGEEVKS
jgi:hypothetical protein